MNACVVEGGTGDLSTLIKDVNIDEIDKILNGVTEFS